MNEVLIENWNRIIKPRDRVYHLGDFVFGCPERIRKRLNGRIFLILGNHDKFGKKWHSLFEGVFQIHEYKNIIMCHYPIRYWNRSHYNSWHLHGHCHGHAEPIGKSFDVGVDCNNLTPLHYDEVCDMMDDRPDNPNIVRR